MHRGQLSGQRRVSRGDMIFRGKLTGILPLAYFLRGKGRDLAQTVFRGELLEHIFYSTNFLVSK